MQGHIGQHDKYGVLNTQVQFGCLLVKASETWAEGIQRMARNKLGTAQEATRSPRCNFGTAPRGWALATRLT